RRVVRRAPGVEDLHACDLCHALGRRAPEVAYGLEAVPGPAAASRGAGGCDLAHTMAPWLAELAHEGIGHRHGRVHRLARRAPVAGPRRRGRRPRQPQRLLRRFSEAGAAGTPARPAWL